MFYSKYLDDFYLEEFYSNYDVELLKNIDEDNFKKVYDVFIKYSFDFIEDIILGYLDIFMLDSKVVEEKIISLKKFLGEDYIDKIGEDMSYLEYIIRSK